MTDTPDPVTCHESRVTSHGSFKYEIGGKTYVQRELTYGDLKRLAAVSQKVGFRETPSVYDFVLNLVAGGVLAEFAAVLITPLGMSPKDKDVAALAKEIEFDLTLEMGLKIGEDFLSCNRTPSVLRAFGMLREFATERGGPSKSTTQSVFSLAETLAGETKSSGDAPPGTRPST